MSDLPLILGLDMAGNPHKWLTYQQTAYYYAKDLVAWSLDGDANYILRGGKSRMTGETSLMPVASIVAIRSKKAGMKTFNGRSIPRLSNKILFRRDRHICAFCGDTFPTSKLTRDHVTPHSKGGKHTWGNLVSACKPCNHRKADRTPEQANMKMLYLPYIPDRAEHLILQNTNIHEDQKEFLIKQIKNKNSRMLCT